MHPPNPDQPHLTPAQLTRLTIARHDLEAARAANLAEMNPPALILLVERLRGSLDDAIRLIDELIA